MNRLYFGDCLDVLRELHKKHQLPGGGTTKHFEENKKKLESDKEEEGMF